MIDKIIFATGNEGKMKEVRMILKDLGLPVLSMKEAGVQADIVEDGTTFEENAKIKAVAVQKLTGALVLADDSGLEIDYLNKEPGIYSARYMGEDTPYSVKNANLISRLAGVPDEQRTARFVCAIAAAFPTGRYSPPGEPSRVSSDTRSGARTASAMIRFFICRNIRKVRQSFPRRRRMR